MEFTKPIEMPRGTHYGSNYFIVYSKKIDRIMKFYSSLEYYNFLTLEMDPLVETFCEQPCEILIIVDGKKQKAVPDMWVRYKDGSEEFQEVKYSAEINGEDEAALRSQEQIKREEAWCKNNNVGFHVRTEKEISPGRCYISNLEILAAKNRIYQPAGNEEYTDMLKQVIKSDKVSVENLIEKDVLPYRAAWEHLSYLFYLGIISMDINNRPLDNKTEVWLCQKN